MLRVLVGVEAENRKGVSMRVAEQCVGGWQAGGNDGVGRAQNISGHRRRSGSSINSSSTSITSSSSKT